jgi:hypothetical protein
MPCLSGSQPWPAIDAPRECWNRNRDTLVATYTESMADALIDRRYPNEREADDKRQPTTGYQFIQFTDPDCRE